MLIGTCTHARWTVDWEVEASLEPSSDGLPSALVAVNLDRLAQKVDLPPRVEANVDSGYAPFYRLPLSAREFEGWIDRAAEARPHTRDLVVNVAPRLAVDLPCRPTFAPWGS